MLSNAARQTFLWPGPHITPLPRTKLVMGYSPFLYTWSSAVTSSLCNNTDAGLSLIVVPTAYSFQVPAIKRDHLTFRHLISWSEILCIIWNKIQSQSMWLFSEFFFSPSFSTRPWKCNSWHMAGQWTSKHAFFLKNKQKDLAPGSCWYKKKNRPISLHLSGTSALGSPPHSLGPH